MDTKELRIEWKSNDGDERIIEGYASTFGPPADLGGDVIEKGAFLNTIQEKPELPLLDSHKHTAQATLGTVISCEEDAHGLKFRAQLADTPQVEEVRQKMLQGHLSKTSIGYDVFRQAYSTDEKGNRIRHLLEVNLYEISVVPLPMNERTSLTSVKSVTNTASSVTQKKRARAHQLYLNLRGFYGIPNTAR